MDDYPIYMLNKATWPLLHGLFIMRHFRKLTPPFTAMHAVQLLNILLHNRAITERNAITRSLGVFYVRSTLSCTDLLAHVEEFTSLSILHNILGAEPPYQDCKLFLGQILDGLKRTSAQLPITVQSEFLEQVRILAAVHVDKAFLDPASILLRLGPILQLVTSSTTSSPDSALSAMLTDRTPMSRSADSQMLLDDRVPPSSEAAFVARQEQRRPRPSADPGRRELRSDDRRGDSRPDFPKDRNRSSGPSRPTVSRPRNESPEPEQLESLDELYKAMASLQSKVDKHRDRDRRHAQQASIQPRRERPNAYAATALPPQYMTDSADETAHALTSFTIHPDEWTSSSHVAFHYSSSGSD